jgi:hypothetical protein
VATAQPVWRNIGLELRQYQMPVYLPVTTLQGTHMKNRTSTIVSIAFAFLAIAASSISPRSTQVKAADEGQVFLVFPDAWDWPPDRLHVSMCSALVSGIQFRNSCSKAPVDGRMMGHL